MSFESFMVQPLTIFNLVEGPHVIPENDYGDDEYEYDAGTVTTGWVAPVQVMENTVDRETRIDDREVFLRPTEQVFGTSRIEWRGQMHEILGEPRPYYQREGLHHYELVMRAVEG